MTEFSAPPNLYFGAKDIRHVPVDNGHNGTDVALSRRAAYLGRIITKVERLGKDVRSLKSFDEMGNIDFALEQLRDRLADTRAGVEELLQDIEGAAARWHNRPDGPAADERTQAASAAPSPADVATYARLHPAKDVPLRSVRGGM